MAGPFLVLAADKGLDRTSGLEGDMMPPIAVHRDAISILVNFDAIGRWMASRGATVREAMIPASSLKVAAYARGGLEATGPRETCVAFAQTLQGGIPDAYALLRGELLPHLDKLSTTGLLALVQLGHYDADTLMAISRALFERAESAPSEIREAIIYTIASSMNQYYPTENLDAVFIWGCVAYRAGDIETALELFEAAEGYHGPHPATTFNQALCRKQLGDELEAKALHASLPPPYRDQPLDALIVVKELEAEEESVVSPPSSTLEAAHIAGIDEQFGSRQGPSSEDGAP
jgi:hypothetical protein